jgi:hypothetical protein
MLQEYTASLHPEGPFPSSFETRARKICGHTLRMKEKGVSKDEMRVFDRRR